jgi:hypothetical protein
MFRLEGLDLSLLDSERKNLDTLKSRPGVSNSNGFGGRIWPI